MNIRYKIQSRFSRWNDLLDDPVWYWGIRIAIAVAVPLLFGELTGQHEAAIWIAIAAESTALIELRGDAIQRIRILFGSVCLNVLFAVLGGVIGAFWWLAVFFMFGVGFLSGLFKNLGEKGAALALSVYVSAVINIAFPITSPEALLSRTQLFLLGGAWAALVNITAVLFIKEGSPFRRSIEAIWDKVALLAQVSGKGWDNKSKRESLRTLYLTEKGLRDAINSSLSYFETTVDKVKDKNSKLYTLTQSRKVAVLVGLHVIQLTEYVDLLDKHKIPFKTRLKIFSLYRVTEQLSERMGHFIAHLKEEERLVIHIKIERLKKVLQQIHLDAADHNYLSAHIAEIDIIINRIIKLFQKALDLHERHKEKISIRSYTFIETINILHPRHLWTNIKALVRNDSLTLRYALRVGISAMTGYLLQYFIFRDHGYWIPLTAIIVSQPFVNATLKKGLQRSLGTMIGVLVSSLLLFIPFPTAAQFGLIVISSLFLVYFLKTRYAMATFFITMLLVAMLYLESGFDMSLMLGRILFTAIGSAIAILAGFLFFPTYDKKLLPKFLAEAVEANFRYFKESFYTNNTDQSLWTTFKRDAEIKNSNAFDSVNRYIQETIVKRKKGFASSYYLIVHNIRITRELNAYHTDNEFNDELMPAHNKELFYQLLYEIDDLFRDMLRLGRLKGNKFIQNSMIEDYPVNGLKNLTPSEHQVIHLLKISNELKAIRSSLSTYPAAAPPHETGTSATTTNTEHTNNESNEEIAT